MGKKKRIIFTIILILIVTLSALGYWQRNNIAALILSMQNSGDDLVTQMEDSHQQMNDAVKDKTDISIRGLSDDEKQALRDNTLSRDELIQELIKPDAPAETPDSSDDAPVETPAADPDREQLSKYIAELYVMQEEYTILLDQYNQSAIDDFNALPVEEQTSSSKYKIGLQYVNLAKAKEKECDARMADMEAKIKALLIKLGDDTALVDEIHQTYLDAKALKKAYYMSLH